MSQVPGNDGPFRGLGRPSSASGVETLRGKVAGDKNLSKSENSEK